MSAEPTAPARIVKPRKRQTKKLPIIAVCDSGILIERTGETHPIDQLPQVIVSEPSSIIVGTWMGAHILRLHEAFKDSDTFQYKLTPIRREANPLNSKPDKRSMLRDTVTTLVGFPGHYHHPIDPNSFIRFTIDEIDKTNAPELVKLLQWGQKLRRFCLDSELQPKASAGGLAAQLLRDPRFYPEARRKVPRLINEKVRDKLPGNYYELYAPAQVYLKATYLDMENSHHYLASQIAFPCANHLHAYGYWEGEAKKAWARPGTPRFERAIKCAGLFQARVSVPHMPKGKFPPPYMRKQGSVVAWIYSNEIPLIKELGGRIEAIYCAMISRECETGLNKYAEWAISEIKARGDDKLWLKPVLHSAYGVLAARPRTLEIGWRLADGGKDDVYPMANKMVPVKTIKSQVPIETKVVNVLHRGMIEAEQRVRSLQLARNLHGRGGKIICIYADSLFVTMLQMPILPKPWRAKDDLHSLRFANATSFTSDRLTRLPGVPRSRRASPDGFSVRPPR